MDNNSDTKNSSGILRVGTSNIVLPGNKKSFPPAFQNKSRLSYYASIFKTIEINSSFYSLPKAKTWVRWASEVTTEFEFSVKLSKAVTHVKDLKFSVSDIDLFMSSISLP